MPRLTTVRQSQIDDTIENILGSIGMRYPEDGLLDIMKAYSPNLQVKNFDFNGATNIRGATRFEDGKHPAVLINYSRGSEEGRTFTLAHEFGHFVLHGNEEKFRLDYVDYGDDTSIEESEANYFAASLLMPRAEFETMLGLTDELEMIATYFGVSKRAVENRKLWLERNQPRAAAN